MRGRGGRGGPRGKPRGRSINDSGPKLPSAIAQEVGKSYAAANAKPGKRGQSIFLVSQRKAARKAARKGKKPGPQSVGFPSGGDRAGQPSSAAREENGPPAKKQRLAPLQLNHHGNESRQGSSASHRAAVQAKQKPVKTKFNELLGADALKATNVRAMEAEDREQRQLAKKLGIRKKGKDAAGKQKTSIREVMAKELEMPDSGDEMFEGQESDSEGGEDASSSEGAMSQESEEDGDVFSDGEAASEEVADAGSSESEDGDSGDSELMHSSDEEPEADDQGQNSKRQSGVGKYLPPAARGRAESEAARLQKRLTGLINRLSDPNLPQVGGELLSLLDAESRRSVTNSITELLLEAAAEGPRATDRFAAVTAALVAGLSGRANAPEIGAHFASELAAKLDTATVDADSLACSNLATLFAQLYVCGLLPSGCMYSLLDALRVRFEEQDVAAMHLLLRVCGFKLRSDDPAAMKAFVVGVHARAAEVAGKMTQRAETMLELVLDIKNNRRAKGSTPASALDQLLGQGSLRWLRESRVADVQLRSVSWQKLLQPGKKGMWWLPAAGEASALGPMSGHKASVESQWGAELLKLAAQQRMNTDVRRAVFCIVMGSDDHTDAAERLLRLPLKGESEREVVRVAVECCLQEAGWNPYYAVLLRTVLAASKAHALTTQFCLWDHLKQLQAQPARRVSNLARLAAELVVLKALPLSALRAGRPGQTGSSQEQLFWNTFFARVLLAPKDDQALLTLLKPVTQPQLQSFAAAMRSYLSTEFDATAAEHRSADQLLARSKLAQKRLLARQPLL